ncbi:hypothetical protein [Actinocorallia lasiicapitis]
MLDPPRAASKLSEYTRTAWGRLEPELRSCLTTGLGPLLFLTDAGVLARYDALSFLSRLADAARQGTRALWLLAPSPTHPASRAWAPRRSPTRNP